MKKARKDKAWKVLLLIGFISSLFSCQSTAHKEVIGSWKLITWEAIEGDLITYPYGPDAQGMLIYTGGGEVSFTLAYNKRDTLPSADRSMVSAIDAKKAFNSYFSYCGTYEVNSMTKEVTHHITLSLLPNWQNTSQTRLFSVNHDTLTLSAPAVFGKYHQLKWIRL